MKLKGYELPVRILETFQAISDDISNFIYGILKLFRELFVLIYKLGVFYNNKEK